MKYYRIKPDALDRLSFFPPPPEVLIFTDDCFTDSYSRRAYAENYKGDSFDINNLVLLNEQELKEYSKEQNKKDISEELIKEVGGTHNKTKGSAVCSWAYRKNGIVIAYPYQVCYSQMSGSGATECVVWDTHFRSLEEKESVRELYDWMVNDSPWLHCISSAWGVLSTQERTDRVINGPIPVNVEAPANEVVGFAVALRTITEHQWTIPTYLRLRELGASKPIAFMLSGFMKYNDGAWAYYANSNWHHFMSITQKVKDLCKFFKEGYWVKGRDLSPFNKRRYSYIAKQLTPEYQDNGGAIGYLILDSMIVQGDGWGKLSALAEASVISVIQSIEKEWQNA